MRGWTVRVGELVLRMCGTVCHRVEPCAGSPRVVVRGSIDTQERLNRTVSLRGCIVCIGMPKRCIAVMCLHRNIFIDFYKRISLIWWHIFLAAKAKCSILSRIS